MIREEINPKDYCYKFHLLSYEICISEENAKYWCENMYLIKYNCIVLFSSSFNNLVTLCSFKSLHSLLWFCNKHRSCQWWKQFSAFINISYFPISITDCKGRRQSITETALNLYHCFVFSDLMSHFTFQLSLMSPLKVWLSRLVA